MRKYNGLYCYSRSSTLVSKIEISSGMKEHFSFPRILETLIHELTHHYVYCKFGEHGHGETFKKYCAMFGGSMNSHMAGEEYAHVATEEFVSREVSFTLVCPCGRCRSKKYLKSPAVSYLKSRWCGSCMVRMDMWEKK